MITMIGATWNCVTKSCRSVGIVVKLTKLLKIDAPITMVNSMAVVRADSTSTSHRPLQVSVRARPGEEEAAEGADAGPSGRREPAAVHAADHQREQQQHRPHVAQGRAAVPPRCCVLRAGPARGCGR